MTASGHSSNNINNNLCNNTTNNNNNNNNNNACNSIASSINNIINNQNNNNNNNSNQTNNDTNSTPLSLTYHCPEVDCEECFDSDCMTFIHFITKHPFAYIKLKRQGSRALIEKVPGAEGSFLIKKLKQLEQDIAEKQQQQQQGLGSSNESTGAQVVSSGSNSTTPGPPLDTGGGGGAAVACSSATPSGSGPQPEKTGNDHRTSSKSNKILVNGMKPGGSSTGSGGGKLSSRKSRDQKRQRRGTIGGVGISSSDKAQQQPRAPSAASSHDPLVPLTGVAPGNRRHSAASNLGPVLDNQNLDANESLNRTPLMDEESSESSNNRSRTSRTRTRTRSCSECSRRTIDNHHDILDDKDTRNSNTNMSRKRRYSSYSGSSRRCSTCSRSCSTCSRRSHNSSYRSRSRHNSSYRSRSRDWTPRRKRPRSLSSRSGDRLHDDKSKVPCLVCNLPFNSAATAFQHDLQKHKDFGRYPCPMCPIYSGNTPRELQKHIETKHPNPSPNPVLELPCIFCNRKFPLWEKFNYHIQKDYSMRRLRQYQNIAKYAPIQCDACKRLYDHSEDFNEHKNQCSFSSSGSPGGTRIRKDPKRPGCEHAQTYCKKFPACFNYRCDFAHASCRFNPCQSASCHWYHPRKDGYRGCKICKRDRDSYSPRKNR